MCRPEGAAAALGAILADRGAPASASSPPASFAICCRPRRVGSLDLVKALADAFFAAHPGTKVSLKVSSVLSPLPTPPPLSEAAK